MKNLQKGSIWIILLVIILIAIIAVIYWFIMYKFKPISTSNTVTQTSSTTALEEWIRSNKVLFNTTSSDTHKLLDGTYRMYFMQNGQIVYADSKNGLNFSNPVSTGIAEEAGKMISNPGVMEISPNNWIMIYEMAPMKTPGEKTGPPGPATQRNLYLAISTDGKTFTNSGTAIDSSKDKTDNYFASVPDLLMLPDGKIRLYYVSGGEAIGSAISSDDGKTWKRESGFRLQDKAVDPDVLLQTENGQTKYIMYYSILTGPGNALYKSISTDGLTWTKGVKVLSAKDNNTSIIDPDVMEITPGQYRMFFGEMTGDSTTGQATPNLYFADTNNDIFNFK